MAKTTKTKTKHKMKWSWPAFWLGPLWYLLHGLWSQASMIFLVMLLSGFVLVLPIAVYCGLRFADDEQEHKAKQEALHPPKK